MDGPSSLDGLLVWMASVFGWPPCMDGLHSSRDIHLEPEMPFYNIVRHVGCPNGNITFPSGTPMCLTVIQIGWVGVQMNVTR